MAYQIKPLSCDPVKIKGMSERLIVSHYENNYVGAVKRLNLIENSSPSSITRKPQAFSSMVSSVSSSSR